MVNILATAERKGRSTITNTIHCAWRTESSFGSPLVNLSNRGCFFSFALLSAGGAIAGTSVSAMIRAREQREIRW